MQTNKRERNAGKRGQKTRAANKRAFSHRLPYNEERARQRTTSRPCARPDPAAQGPRPLLPTPSAHFVSVPIDESTCALYADIYTTYLEESGLRNLICIPCLALPAPSHIALPEVPHVDARERNYNGLRIRHFHFGSKGLPPSSALPRPRANASSSWKSVRGPGLAGIKEPTFLHSSKSHLGRLHVEYALQSLQSKSRGRLFGLN